MSYLFICQKCNKEFEMVADFATILTLKPNCPNCNSNEVRRKYLPTNFILSGNGFYSTDKRNNR
jgi:putative FmdB family regulatory protein